MIPRWFALGVFAAAAALADQDPGIVLRDWRIQGERNPLATFVRFDGSAAVMSQSSGRTRCSVRCPQRIFGFDSRYCTT